MSLSVHGGRRRRERFPRVSGDEPRLTSLTPSRPMFSPRERG